MIYNKFLYQFLWRCCFVAICTYTLSACNFDPNEPISWKTDLLLPIAHSSLGVEDILSDSATIEVESDQFVNIVYRDTLLRTGLSEVFQIPDTTIIRRFDLATFQLADQVIVQRITLAQLARGLVEQGNLAGLIILANHGNEIPPITQDITGLSSGVIAVDASDLFEYAALNQGDMEIEIANYLPLSLKNIQLELKNSGLGTTIVSDFYPIVPSKDSLSRYYTLDNQEVESALAADMSNLDIGNSGGMPVLIDTTDYVQVTITVKNLKAREATAVFPDQTVADQTEDLVYEFSGDMSDIELKQVTVKSGFIRAEIVSTIEDTIQFEYTLNGAMKDGLSPKIKRKIPPAPPDGTSQFVEIFDLAGYDMDLTKGGDTINTLEQAYQIDLVYSGKLVHIDLNDSVYARFQLIDIVPDYVQGYLGQGTIDVVDIETLNIFQQGEVQLINFEEATAKLSFINSIGLDLEGELNFLSGFRRQTGGFVELYSDIFDNPIEIRGPKTPIVGEAETTTITLDNENSNLRELVNLVPDEISYDLSITYNPKGKEATLNNENFAYFDSEVITYLDLELPVHGIAETFLLTDTVEVDFGDNANEKIEGGTLKLLIENEFPLEAIVYARFVDRNNQTIDILVEGQKIAAGKPGVAERVEIPTPSTLEKSFDQATMDDIIANAYQLIIGYRLSTGGTSVKLYNDYKLKAKLVGEFKYGL